MHLPMAKRSSVISSYGESKPSFRSEHGRNVRYEDVSEEPYHHHTDSTEWVSEAGNPDHAKVKRRLAKFAPRINTRD